jgi:hypothetical protein
MEKEKKLVTVVFARYPSDSGKLNIGRLWFRLDWGKKGDPIRNSQREKGWRCGSSSREPA